VFAKSKSKNRFRRIRLIRVMDSTSPTTASAVMIVDLSLLGLVKNGMFFRAEDGSKIQRLRRRGGSGPRFLQETFADRAVEHSVTIERA